MGNFSGAFGKLVALRTLPLISLGFNSKAGQEVLVRKHNDFHTVDLDSNSCK